MDINEFGNRIAAILSGRLGGGYQISAIPVRKNNNVMLTGLSIARKGYGFSPVIRLEPYYEQYRENKITVMDAANEVVCVYREHEARQDPDLSFLQDYEGLKARLKGRLVNTGMNGKFLKTVPHRDFLDLSLVYMVVMDSADGIGGDLAGYATVTNWQMDLWGVTEPELFSSMEHNMEEGDDALIAPLSDVLWEMMGEATEQITGLEGGDAVPLYLVSNKSMVNGAVSICSKKVMREAAEMVGTDFFILPSSIHEVLLFPCRHTVSGEDDIRGLSKIVEEVNHVAVPPDEVLSFHVYRYSREDGRIAIAI